MGLINIAILIYLSGNMHDITLTAYSPEVSQCDSRPFEAKCGPVKECTIALSRDMKIKCGAVVIVPFDNECFWLRINNDTMAKRKKNWGDLFYFDKQVAVNHGIKKNAVIFVF
jgi:3D (Asp-Asp-Asp) domain-containing protein